MTNQPVTASAHHARSCAHSDRTFSHTLEKASLSTSHVQGFKSWFCGVYALNPSSLTCLHHSGYLAVRVEALQVSFMFSFSCLPHVLHISRSPFCRIFRFSGFKTFSIRAFQRCQCHLKASSGSRDIHNLAFGWGFGLMG